MRAISGLFAVALLAGCGPEAQVVVSTPTAEHRGTGDLTKLPQVYAAFDFSMCPNGTDCAALFAQRAGFDLGPSGKNAVPSPRGHQNQSPDPVWIPEWARLPTGEAGAHYAFEALALAAVRKTWRAACDKAYGEYDRRVGTQMAALDRSIADLNRDPNPYDRLAGLLKLAPDAPRKGKMSAFTPGSDAVRYRYEVALFEAFEDTKRTFVYTFDGHAPSEELLGAMHIRQPKEYENDAFCLAALRGRVDGVPVLDTSTWDSGVRSMVRQVIPDERATYLEQRRAELADVTRTRFAKAMIPNPTLPPGVREVSIPKVSTFTRDGKRAIITSLITKEEQTPSKLVKVDETAVASFEDWPSGVVLDPGDSVSFYGAELSAKELVLKGTPELEHKSRSYQFDGKHVTKLTTKGKTTVYFK